MAAVSQLVKVLANVTGLPERTINVYARALLDAGMLPLTKGRAIAHVTPRHCANLITVVAARPTLKRAADFVAEFAKTEGEFSIRQSVIPDPNKPGWMTSDAPGCDPIEGEGRWHLDGFSLPRLQSLPAGHSFLDAVTAFIEAMMDDEFVGILATAGEESGSNYGFEFFLHEPSGRASIELEIWRPGTGRYTEEVAFAAGSSHEEGGDLQTRHYFTWRTIIAVARLLKLGEVD